MEKPFGVSNDKKKRAFFITFEGMERSGKTTVGEALAKFLQDKGLRVAIFCDPGSTSLGEEIRKLLLDRKNEQMSPYTELLLYLAARIQLIEEKLKPAFKVNDVVICDRFTDSTLVYQGYGLGLGRIVEDVIKMFSFNIEPDLTIVLDTDVNESLERIIVPDRIEGRSVEFHRRLREGYKEIAQRFPQRVCLVESQDLRKVIDRVKEIVSKRLKLK